MRALPGPTLSTSLDRRGWNVLRPQRIPTSWTNNSLRRRAPGISSSSGMEYTTLGQTDLRVSKVCLGTMTFGEFNSYSESRQILEHAVERGVNFFDTAEMYPVPQRPQTQGASEQFLGRWLQATTTRREDIVIATKVTGPSGQMTWIRDGPQCLDAAAIQEAVEGSLTRLGTEYVDLVQLHWPDRYVPMFGETEYDPVRAYSSVPIEDQMDGLQRLVDQGKVRQVGLSNETAWGLMRFLGCAPGGEDTRPGPPHTVHDPASESSARSSGSGGAAAEPSRGGSGRVATLQNAYNLLCRQFDLSLAECCHAEAVSLLAYSPLAMGHLTGKYLAEDGGAPTARLNLYRGRYAEAECRYSFTRPNLMAAVREYQALGDALSMPLLELALRFVLSHPLLGSMVVGATSVEQLDQQLNAVEKGPLEESLMEEIDRIHLRFPSPAG